MRLCVYPQLRLVHSPPR